MNILNLRLSIFDEHFKGGFDWPDFKFVIWPVISEMVYALIQCVINEKEIDCDYKINIIEKLTGQTWEKTKELINA